MKLRRRPIARNLRSPDAEERPTDSTSPIETASWRSAPPQYDPRAAGSGLRESEEKSDTRKSTHDSRDESVAADAVEAERLSGRDCVQLPLQQAVRAMKAEQGLASLL